MSNENGKPNINWLPSKLLGNCSAVVMIDDTVVKSRNGACLTPEDVINSINNKEYLESVKTVTVQDTKLKKLTVYCSKEASEHIKDIVLREHLENAVTLISE